MITAVIFFILTASAHAELYVLCYHSFLGRSNVPYDFSTDELKSHLEYFKQKGFTFVSYRDFLAGNIAGKKNILVTIDDGNHSVYNAYYEVLKPMGIKPLLSIYPNIIGKKEYAMNWSQLKSLVSEGCEIAAHGYFHLKLNKQLYNEKRSDFLQEINKSKKMLEEKLGITVTSFVYPFGLAIEETVHALRNAGYKTAFTIVSKPVRLPISANANPYKLPRFMFTRSLAKSDLIHIARHAGVKEQGKHRILDKSGIMPVSSNENVLALPSSGQKRSDAVALTRRHKKSKSGEKKIERKKVTRDAHTNKNGTMKKNKPFRKDTPEIPSKKAKELDMPDLVKNYEAPYDLVYSISGMNVMTALHVETEKGKRKQSRELIHKQRSLRPPEFLKSRWDSLVLESLSLYNMVLRVYFLRIDNVFKKMPEILNSLMSRVKTLHK